MNCPYCGEIADDPEYVYIDLGYSEQVSPHRCFQCEAVEMSRFDTEGATADEVRLGWWAPPPIL